MKKGMKTAGNEIKLLEIVGFPTCFYPTAIPANRRKVDIPITLHSSAVLTTSIFRLAIFPLSHSDRIVTASSGKS
jgi:hypothetical protein